ncbi:MAG TPA: hypothetical protein VM619_00540 [Luteimonas sp.]|nr:hypothetical protein [Luteimonas sp.]
MHLPQPARRRRQLRARDEFGAVGRDDAGIVAVRGARVAQVEAVERRPRASGAEAQRGEGAHVRGRVPVRLQQEGVCARALFLSLSLEPLSRSLEPLSRFAGEGLG